MVIKHHVVHIALGSNLGSSAEHIRGAVNDIRSLNRGHFEMSSLWLSDPVGFAESVPDFLNAVVRLETGLDPHALLTKMQAFERSRGRHRSQTIGYESRTIDLDIIDFGGMRIGDQQLVLPHPRACERLFVLLPLREVSPGFKFPSDDRDLDQLIKDAPETLIRKL
jgi:2-amino-4-hydroxy-6-hydroxymethyldihydropteridine diphosphokinase